MPELSELTGAPTIEVSEEERADRSLAALNAWSVVTGVIYGNDDNSELMTV